MRLLPARKARCRCSRRCRRSPAAWRRMSARAAWRKRMADAVCCSAACRACRRPTTHSNPTYLVDEVVHYCVTNMPGAVARTSTFALNNMTLPFVLTLAEEGARRALGEDVHLRNGLNVYDGMVTHRAVADALKIKCTPAEAALRL